MTTIVHNNERPIREKIRSDFFICTAQTSLNSILGLTKPPLVCTEENQI